ncbi:MAG: phosphate acyltransferase PlsX [Desulfovibrionaceae bacterium]|nr:phosphate acyltransferase PlsX [Desulfovibrionaceae bacterium]MDD4951052.1 phosphate acyltransferase PlsX [Desulfovibrionaceae bacterium]
MAKTPVIAVDAMGGDFGPRVIVPAAVDAVKRGLCAVLVGDETQVRAELARCAPAGADLEVVHASQVVGMNEKPSEALRRKKDSSIQVACNLVQAGAADGVVSAGNSGATVACGMFTLGRIKGVQRPGLAGVMPTEKNPIVVIDVGANVDSKPSHLFQFAIMADALAKDVLGVPNPKVGLLSIGEEEGKGNLVVKEAFDFLRRSSLNFIGNVEGRDIFTGEVDVIVCDGFVGNVVLKLSEGMAKSFGNVLKAELRRNLSSKLGAMLSMPALSRFAAIMDYAEYGGAPLLGLNGIVIVCHGASNSKAMTNAIGMASTFVSSKTHKHMTEVLMAHSELAEAGRRVKV